MVSRLFLLYVVAELAVVVALASTIGLGWTLLLLLAAFVGGLALAGSQLKVQMSRLFNGGGSAPAAADGMAVALGTLLVVTPGLLTSVAGLLLLLPPTRAAARPLLSGLAMRGLGRRIPLITVVGANPYARRSRPDYVDGEVLDVNDVTEFGDPPALGPRRPNA